MVVSKSFKVFSKFVTIKCFVVNVVDAIEPTRKILLAIR